MPFPARLPCLRRFTKFPIPVGVIVAMTALPDSFTGTVIAFGAHMMMQRRIAAVSLAFAFLSIEELDAEARTVDFAGMQWTVKDSAGQLVGPGPNFFSDAPENVFVSGGELHLRIRRVTVGSEVRWLCSEVIAPISFGFGTYKFFVRSNIDALDPQAVLGMFVFDTRPTQRFREIDIEASRFGNADASTNTQYVVQPSGSNLFRFFTPGTDSLHQFTWSSRSVFFQSFNSAGQRIAQFTTRKAPSPGNEKTRINLWLFRGLPPQNPPQDGIIEMVISDFEYEAPGGTTSP